MTRSLINFAALALGALTVASCRPADGKTRTAAAQAGSATAVGAADSLAARADQARIMGSPNAKLWIVLLSDFQCPYCKRWHDSTATQMIDEYVKTGKAKLAYVNFPLQNHGNAWPAATAAMCAGAQGKFWPMQDAIFGAQARWQATQDYAPIFDSLARQTGVNIAAWRTCLKSPDIRALIQSDYDRGVKAGVNSTPSFIIGNQIIAGAAPIADFRKVIDAALANSAK